MALYDAHEAGCTGQARGILSVFKLDVSTGSAAVTAFMEDQPGSSRDGIDLGVVGEPQHPAPSIYRGEPFKKRWRGEDDGCIRRDGMHQGPRVMDHSRREVASPRTARVSEGVARPLGSLRVPPRLSRERASWSPVAWDVPTSWPKQSVPTAGRS